MKIIQLITQDQLRGAEVFAAQLSDELVARGHQVVLAHLLGEAGALATRPEVRRVGLGGAITGRVPLSLAVWRNLRRLIKDFRPDIIQANGSEALKYAALLRSLDRRRHVVYRNISVMSMWSGSVPKKRLVGLMLRRMSHVASVTQVGAKVLVEDYGLATERVSVIPIGVNVPPDMPAEQRQVMRAEARRRAGVPEDAPLIIHVGSFAPEKNHKELIEAFAMVVERMPEVRLLLVGDGPLRGETEANISRAGLGDRVVPIGSIPDAASLIAAADVLALPSLREGLPGVILEAGAAGVPVVAYGVGGVAEVVKDGVTGVLVRVGDVSGLAAALIRVLAHPEAREQFGDEGRRVVASQFGLPTVAGAFEALYSRLAGE